MLKWISAARLRTLPLALSSIFMGTFLAIRANKFGFWIFLFACLTTILLQVLSNFANDYGDFKNGADLKERIGPKRAVQSGEISSKQMMKGILIVAFLSFFSGLILLYISFDGFFSLIFWKFVGIGILCIVAAFTYTAGKRPYGYIGLGDVSVFIFFGIVGVMGSYFLFTKNIDLEIILPAVFCGLLATGVLNLNNIRDIVSDKAAGKITIPVRLGRKKAIIYHFFLLTFALLSLFAYVYFHRVDKYYYLISLPLILLNAFQLLKIENPDPLLKSLALTTLVSVILFGISII